MIVSELKEKLNTLPEWADGEEISVIFTDDSTISDQMKIHTDDIFEIRYIDCLPTGVNMVIE